MKDKKEWYINTRTRKITPGKDGSKNTLTVNMQRLKWDKDYKEKIIKRFQSIYYAMKGIVIKGKAYKRTKGRVRQYEEALPKAYGRCTLNHDRRKQEPAEHIKVINITETNTATAINIIDYKAQNKNITENDL